MNQLREFSPAGYRSLLKAFLDAGYEAVDYGEAVPERAHLILRHDLDMSLQAAEQIGALEKELGVSAHYFVLLRTEMYNLFSENSLKAIETLIGLGHRIGLHFDASLYDNDEMEDAAEWEAGCLQCLTGAEVSMISFHRPAHHLLGDERPLAGRPHAYQPRFFEEITYCSDSRGKWAYGHPLDLPVFAEKRSVQLLTHPIWWTGNSIAGAVPRLDTFVEERDRVLRRELARNCEPYQSAYGAFDEDAS